MPIRGYIRHMITGPLIAEIAVLVGEPARATMLSALLDGGALTATELAYAARVTPQTASTHLARLTEAGLLSPIRDGRHHPRIVGSRRVGQLRQSPIARFRHRELLPAAEYAMEMHQVRYFLAVAEDPNFTKAAERCNVSQPALSRAIQALEQELGGPLFNRERRHTHLSE